ncbi:hypothetical protein HMPREF0494_0154 [Limosilactobacillus antri DSM 16041]|uniref:Uncharacterized protein n=1 Tax=Limosilactobacillus antri DSM 16041 TaxID=525309 RepID=C8P4B0_9LACO|nr:hypothetical protein HMPREF0494_0154 [Limosilactobacillus antri DSM 16041]
MLPVNMFGKDKSIGLIKLLVTTHPWQNVFTIILPWMKLNCYGLPEFSLI